MRRTGRIGNNARKETCKRVTELNVGIIGCGRITDLHAPGYARSGRAGIFAVCDVRPEVAERRKIEWGAQKAYSDYRDLLADPDVHLVEIIVPHHLHKQVCIHACEAGKHVSVQKPMALTVSECDSMIQAARENNVKLKVFENFVFYPPYVKARELIADGAIGEPLSIRIHLGGGGKGGWKVPLSSWLWRLNADTCGGGPNIFDDGYHKFSLAIDFFGDIEVVNGWVDRSFGVVDSPAMISWKYKNGMVGYLDSTFSPHMTVKSKYYTADERVEITGSEGVIQIQRCTARLLDEPVLTLYRNGATQAFEDLRDDWLDAFIDSTLHFVDVVLEGGEPHLTGERGRQVLQFSHAAIKSSNTGVPVRPDEIIT